MINFIFKTEKHFIRTRPIANYPKLEKCASNENFIEKDQKYPSIILNTFDTIDKD